jgi:hypothetical protein
MNRINPKTGQVVTAVKVNIEPLKAMDHEITCPHCGFLANGHTCVTDNQGPPLSPEPGNLSICPKCSEPAMFDMVNDKLDLRKITPDEMAEIMSDPEAALILMTAKASIDAENPDKAAAYEKKMDQMAADLKAWRLANPNTSPIITYPADGETKVAFICTMKEAVDNHIVGTNDDAKSMLKSLGWIDDNNEAPTLTMVRIVMEHVFGDSKD